MVVVMKKVSEDYVMNSKAAKKIWPGAVVLDLTLNGAMGRVDPAFPLGKIKVPTDKWIEGHSIMGVWEGLKVFSKKNMIDVGFMNDPKKVGKQRGCKSYGKLLGIKIDDKLIEGDENLKDLFSKFYKDVIEEKFIALIENLRDLSKEKNLVLLDYGDGDERYPASHVELIKELIEK